MDENKGQQALIKLAAKVFGVLYDEGSVSVDGVTCASRYVNAAD